MLTVLAVGGVAVMVILPRLRPKPRDAVEKVAARLPRRPGAQDEEAAGKLSTIEEPPGIGSYRDLTHRKSQDRVVRGSFATVAALNKRIDKDFTYDATAGRFIPKNTLGIAAETLDSLHAAKDEAKKSGMYEKMQSGDPNDIFDSAEMLGKTMEKLSSEMLSPKRLVPTYKMLIESAKPPLSEEAKALAMAVAEDPKRWSALLKRPFWTLKADGPFIYEEAVVTATGRDRLASLGDPPSRFRLELVRFRLEAIDTGWKVVWPVGSSRATTSPNRRPLAEVLVTRERPPVSRRIVVGLDGRAGPTASRARRRTPRRRPVRISDGIPATGTLT